MAGLGKVTNRTGLTCVCEVIVVVERFLAFLDSGELFILNLFKANHGD
jgi:hypothetical protein